MSESLRDQLIKAGLAREDQNKHSKRPRRRPKKKAKPAARPSGPDESPEVNLAAAYKARQQQERKERKEAERAEREAAEERRRSRARIRKLLDDNRLNDPEAAIPYHFSVGDKIKHVYVTEDQQQRLADGKLAIVLLDGHRHLIPAEIGRNITELDPSRVVVVHEPGDADSEES